MLLADVVVDIPVKSLDTPYTYIIPDELEGANGSFSAYEVSKNELSVRPGCAVFVPFGRSKRRELAFVIDVYEGIPPKGAKYIFKVLSEPYFSKKAADCAIFLSKRYAAPLSACLRLFVPSGAAPKMVRSSCGIPHLQEPTVGPLFTTWVKLLDFDYKPRANAAVQKSILQVLKDAKDNTLPLEALSVIGKNVSSSVKSLEAVGAVKRLPRRTMRFECFEQSSESAYQSKNCKPCVDADAYYVEDDACLRQTVVVDNTRSLTLTKGQAKALECIKKARQSASGQVVLVDGVTGSGKTEVYLRVIEDTIREGRSAIVLVPEISLTPQTVRRFRARFGDAVAVLHSAMGAGERFDMWEYIKSGKVNVVVGARSALFAPLENVGVVIIDEEHESTYKQESSPRYHARDVAIWMMEREGGTVVLGSATPCIESLYSAKYDSRWHYVKMSERANGAALPDIEVVDMSLEFRGENKSIFSAPLKNAIFNEIEAGNKIILLLNQRGFASFMICRECGFVPSCVHCSTSLTLHAGKNALICHHCGYSVPTPGVCPVCRSPYMRTSGIGTERVQADLENLVNVPVVRMDADTTSTKGSHERLLEEFSQHRGSSILLGTQMIAKGLDFEDVTLVGVVNADTQLNLPDFRANERTFALISQVAGRAGRAKKPGKVIIQTYNPDAPAIQFSANYNRADFLKYELQRRRALRLPPYSRMANIVISGRDWRAVEQVSEATHSLLVSLSEQITQNKIHGSESMEIEVLPPCECVISQKNNNYRMHVLVKTPRAFDLSQMLCDFKRELKAFAGISVAVDIDPLDLL